MERKLGYAIERENREQLEERGEDPRRLLRMVKNSFPNHKAPSTVEDVRRMITACKNQLSVGACQGFALSMIFAICFWMAVARWFNFSAKAAYILSQKEDRLIGRDVGSTLSGGQTVATQIGLPLDEDWPFEGRYDPNIRNVDKPFKVKNAKATNDPDLIIEALKAGLPVQIGVEWDQSLEAAVVDNWTPPRRPAGGHSIIWWGWYKSGTFAIHSWGEHAGDRGIAKWSESVIRKLVRHRGNVFVIYGPDGMEYPELPPVSM